MLVRSRAYLPAAAALGLLLSVGVALPASAAPASPEPLSPEPLSPELVSTAPRLAARDLLTLQGVMAVLDSRSGRVPNSVTGWYVDPASNSVVVSATDDAVARAFAAGQDKVRIEHVNARPALLADLRGGDTITTSSGGRCSVGFNAVRGRTRYVITAGHCTSLGGTWSGPDGSVIGPVATSSFPGHDFGLVEVTSPSWAQTHDVETDSGYLPVTGDVPAVVGQEVCLSGSTSGYHCGRVESIDETVNYGGGNVVHGLTGTSVCAEAGDSGGSFMSGTQAQGTLSGGNGGCLLGGQSYFQPIQEVLTTYRLTLITGEASRDDR
ncbi:MAG TPA: S1 family peptidase [Pseudonocardiaceae bacterium]|nr:S1 family peptidase [Pseudonocardiaceae bacterium]